MNVVKSISFRISIIALSAITLVSCGNDANKGDTKTAEEAAGHEHTYACPMHPEVTGKAGDKCPKCGMLLEHNDNAAGGNGNSYFMQFETQPATVNPNEEVTLVLEPKMRGNEGEAVPLDIEHEKKIHLIIVSDDLAYFDHIHPEMQADGKYVVKAKFPTGGKYTLFADYKPTGGNHTLDKLTVNVTGNAPAPKTYSSDKLVSDAGDGFSVTLSPANGEFVTGVPMHLQGQVTLNGKNVDPQTLENYLGAKAHMVVVSLDEKEYLHVHPGVETGKFDLHTTFEKPGVYRGWIQFQSKGKIYTADFVMNVKQGSTMEAPADPHAGH